MWRVKDKLAAEAGYDIDRFVEQLRAWSRAHPATGPVIRDAEELHRLTTGKAVHNYPSATVKPAQVREKPSPKPKKR
jgi:hypothetical protein